MAIMVRRACAIGHKTKVTMRTGRCMEIELQIEGKAVRARSIYPRPDGSKRLACDYMTDFDGAHARCNHGGRYPLVWDGAYAKDHEHQR